MKEKKKRTFTLIELLVVIAIIADSGGNAAAGSEQSLGKGAQYCLYESIEPVGQGRCILHQRLPGLAGTVSKSPYKQPPFKRIHF